MARRNLACTAMALAALLAACGAGEPELDASAPATTTTTTTTTTIIEQVTTTSVSAAPAEDPVPEELALADGNESSEQTDGSRNIAIDYDRYFFDQFGDLPEVDMPGAYLGFGSYCEGFNIEFMVGTIFEDPAIAEQLLAIDPADCDGIYFTWDIGEPGSDPTEAATWEQMIELRSKRLLSWGTTADFEDQARTVCSDGLRGLDISAFSTLTFSAELEMEAIVQHRECDLLAESSVPAGTNAYLTEHLTRWYADDNAYFGDEAIACMSDHTEREGEPAIAVMDLIVMYCVPDLYIDGWAGAVDLPGAAGAEYCFARVVVEQAVAGSLLDAAWFGIDRWDPPEPERTQIADTLKLECGFTMEQWVAAGLVGPSAIEAAPDSASRRQFCEELFDVSYGQQLALPDDAASFLANEERALAAYSALTAPESLTEEFAAFVLSQQITVDAVRENGWTLDEWLDAELTSEDVGLTPEEEAALGRFLDFRYIDCYQ